MTQQEIERLTLQIAVDACWSAIESASLGEMEGDIEWMNVTDELAIVEDEFRLLLALKLAEVHPNHPAWIREIAEL